MVFDTIIVGGGPAAVAAGVYAARKQMKAMLVADQIGGQSVVSDGIANWIGDILIPGPELAKKLKDHLESYKEDISLSLQDTVTSIERDGDMFLVKTKKDVYKTKTVIVTTGGRHRKLGVPGEDDFNGKGVAYCATCDAPFFRDKDVAVVGGGNSGLESVVDLLPYAKKVYLLARRDELRGDPITQKIVRDSGKVEILYKTNTLKISGSAMVESLLYEDKEANEEKELAVQGVFVEIGTVPNSSLCKGLVDLNDREEIIVDHRTFSTSMNGIYAAGDVTDELYKQNNIAVGDAIKATLSAYEYVKKFGN